jgi:uncharacterized RDD family membrane protein YckC
MTTSPPIAPAILRRFAASIYEFALLFGIYFIVGGLVQVAFALVGKTAPIWVLQITIFLAFGYYFTYSWTRAGQTLAQKTWHIQVTQVDGVKHVTHKQAWLRYVFSYLGVLPALLLLFTQTHGQTSAEGDNAMVIYIQVILFMIINCLALLGTSLMNPQRRAVHEVLSGSRTIHQPAA